MIGRHPVPAKVVVQDAQDIQDVQEFQEDAA